MHPVTVVPVNVFQSPRFRETMKITICNNPLNTATPLNIIGIITPKPDTSQSKDKYKRMMLHIPVTGSAHQNLTNQSITFFILRIK